MTKREELAALIERVDSTDGFPCLLDDVAAALRDYETTLEAIGSYLEHMHHTGSCNYTMGWHDDACNCGHDAALAALRNAQKEAANDQ